MTTVPKKIRFAEFVARVAAHRPRPSNRDEALNLMKRVMDEIEDGVGLPRDNFVERMHIFGWGFNWKDLDKNPCWWDDAVTGTHRTFIYEDGRIRIIRRP